MALESENGALIVRYLLDELTGEERRLFEQRYFCNDQLFESVQSLETQLIRDFLQGDLPADQSRRFQAHYLQSSELREKVEFARSLVQSASGDAPLAPTIRDKLLDFFRLRTVVFGFAGSLAALAILVGVWMGLDNGRLRTTVERTESERNSTQGGIAPPKASKLQESAQQTANKLNIAPLAFMLSPGVKRGDDSGRQRIVIPATGVDRVLLNLNFTSFGHYTTYRIIVSSVNGNDVSKRDLQGNKLSIDLPTAKLPEGDYTILVKGRSGSVQFEDIESFYFHVSRR
jgi:hypothetical protein